MLELLERQEENEAIRELEAMLDEAIASCDAGQKFTSQELHDYFEAIYTPAAKAA